MRVLTLLVLAIAVLPCVFVRVDAGTAQRSTSASVQVSLLPPRPSSGPTELPNLKPYTPAGWSGPIVVSKVSDTHTDDFPITAEDYIYIDIAIINDSTVDVPSGTLAYVTLYFDDLPIAAYYANGLPGNACLYITDILRGPWDSGQHSLRACADTYAWVVESNEDDNCVVKPVGIDEAENPVIRAEPAAVVIEREVLIAPPSGQALRALAVSARRAEDWTIHLKSRELDPAEMPSDAVITQALPRGRDKGHVLLQLGKIPTVQERKLLEAQGVKLLDYVPNKAWFASVPTRLGAAELKAAGVRAVVPLSADDKLSPAIRRRGVGTWCRKGNAATVHARFFDDVTPQAAHRLVSKLGGKLKARGSGVFEITLPIARLTALASLDEVQWVQDGDPPKIELNDLARSSAFVDEVLAAPYNLTGSGVAIAIWDSGRVDETHADLAGRVVFGDSTYPVVSEHATHVAGTMAGTGVRSEALGGTPYQWKGVAPDADVVSYFWDDNISEYPAAVITQGAVISQNSWGWVIGYSAGSGSYIDNCDLFGNYESDQAAYDRIIAGYHGRCVTICWAAGNDRNDCSPTHGCDTPTGYYCIAPPATSKNMITVGAINSNDDSMTDFGAWGPTDDGRVKPEVVAAGCQAGGDQGTTSCGASNDYSSHCGTSMACPVVSGVAALIVERFRQTTGNTPLPSTVKALLVHSAIDLGNPGPDYCFGYGKVNAKGAIDLVDAGAFREGVMENQGETETVAEYLVDVPDRAGPFKATLVWDDAPGPENNSISLVNDLNIELVDPFGVTYLPWVLNPSVPSQVATTGVDNRNVVEQVLVTNSSAGQWRVRIRGRVVTATDQNYSLVCSFLPAQDTVNVHNDGISGLRVSSITKEYGSEWLVVTPTAFQVSAGQFQEIGVEVGLTNLQPQTYTETLLLNWNKPEGSELLNPYPVQVELHVIPRYQESSVAAVKMRAPDTAIRISGKVVTAGTDKMGGAFYIEETDRSSGIRVVPKPGTEVATGGTVTIDGKLAVEDGELSIVDATVNVLSSGDPVPGPLGVNVLALGGGTLGYQESVWSWRPAFNPSSGGYEPALTATAGLSNVGLLVQLAGQVTGVSGNTLYVRDGTDMNEGGGAPVGTRVFLSTGTLPALSVGGYVAVTGISSCTLGPDGKPVRLLRVPDPAGIAVIR